MVDQEYNGCVELCAQMLPSNLGLLLSLDHQAKKKVILLVGMIKTDKQQQTGLMLTNMGKENLIRNKEILQSASKSFHV